MRSQLALLSAALWWGSLSTIGFVVVPMLFAHLATPAIAGAMAAKLFTAQSWLAIGCALLLLMAMGRNRLGDEDAHSDGASPAAVLPVVAGLLLALLIEYAVAPRIIARQNLKLWHGLGTAMFVLQWLCAGVALWRLNRQARS